MRLTKEQRIEIILMAGSGSSLMVALNFNRKHGTNITHDTVAKLISKFKKTGNVLMRVHRQWETRVNMCFENNGNHIEHII